MDLEFEISNLKFAGRLRLIAQLSFPMSSIALWQVAEIEQDRVRNSEFGLRSESNSAIRNPHSALPSGAVAQLVER